MDILIFYLFWINTVIHVLPEAPIRGRTNPKFYRKRQSKFLPNFIMKKNKFIVFI